MAFEMRDMTGSLFPNEYKQHGDSKPDHKGKVMIGGKVWEIAGWIKSSSRGEFLSLKISEPRQQQGQPRQAQQRPPVARPAPRQTQAERVLNEPYAGEDAGDGALPF